MHIESLYRYPGKGLPPEPLDDAHLTPGRCLPWDRAFALSQGDSTFNPENPVWAKKTNFMCLARNARIAGPRRWLRRRWPRPSSSPRRKAERLEADPLTPAGQDALTAFLTERRGSARSAMARTAKPRALGNFPDHSSATTRHR